MAIDSVHTLVQELRSRSLVEPNRLDELTRVGLDRCSDPRALCRLLIERDWLTPYQVNQLLQGKAADLKIGSYVILERLGASPSGEQFKARHQHLRRLAGLHVVRAELLAAPGAVQRFYAEVQAVSQLAHRHLITAYDAGPVGTTHFFAWEYVEGCDLQSLVERAGPLPTADACRHVYQAALGLQHAYEHRLLHHDLRPGNLWLASGTERSASAGLLKVCNLGLTILRQDIGPAARNVAARPLADVPERWDYTAPEECAAPATVDVRAELYGLGGTLYFLLAGQPPFPGGTAAQKLQRHQQEQVAPLATLRPDVSAEVVALVDRLLAKQPDDRYQTPAEVAAALIALPGVGDGNWDTTSGRSTMTLPTKLIPGFRREQDRRPPLAARRRGGQRRAVGQRDRRAVLVHAFQRDQHSVGHCGIDATDGSGGAAATAAGHLDRAVWTRRRCCAKRTCATRLRLPAVARRQLERLAGGGQEPLLGPRGEDPFRRGRAAGDGRPAALALPGRRQHGAQAEDLRPGPVPGGNRAVLRCRQVC